MNFRPVGHRVDVGLAAVPRQGRRVTNHGARESVLDVDAGQPAGKGVQVDAGDAQGVRRVGAIVRVVGRISVVTHTDTCLSN